MSIVADLHVHSKYSRAVSEKMDLYEIASWADKKGINLVATGDWTHPLWFRHLNENLVEEELGIFKIKNSHFKTRFILSTEISSIYSQNKKTRRIHSLVFSPSFKTCQKIITKLTNLGINLMSDGRPIINLSAKELLELILEVDQNTLLIPAHIWTPWFSLYGSKSGFDSINECFDNLSNQIFAVETGLSSDPIMNWQIKELETRSIVSFSDAHSGQKLGREATVFILKNKLDLNNQLVFSYIDIINAIKNAPDAKLKIGYTIEFFPEEGKYHWSGHRLCNIRYSPKEIKEKGIICPVCHKPLTIGVENRVLELSYFQYNQDEILFVKNKNDLTFVIDKEKKRTPFVSLVPLLEILTEINNGSIIKAHKDYEKLISILGNEFEILTKINYQEIEKKGGVMLKEAIKKVRSRSVFVDPGFDGVFGQVKIFNKDYNEIENQSSEQKTLF